MRLRAKILCLLVPLLVLPVAGLSYIGTRYFSEHLRQAHVEGLGSLVRQMHNAAENELLQAARTLRLLSENPVVRQYMMEESPTRYTVLESPFLRLGQSLRRASSGILDIRFMMPDGTIDFSVSNGTVVGQKANYLSRLEDGQGNEQRLLQRRGEDGAPEVVFVLAIHLANPATDAVGATPRFRGFLAMHFSLDFLLEQLAGYGDAESRVVLVERATADYLSVQFGERFLPPSESLQGLLRSLPGTQEFGPHVLDKNLLVLGRYLEPGMVLLGLVDDTAVQAPARKLQQVSALLALVMAAVVTLIMYVGLDRLLLRRLKFLTGQIDRVRLNEEVADPGTVPGNDELSQVTRHFLTSHETLREASQAMTRMAFSDGLTGLPNKVSLHENIGRALEMARRRHGRVALMFLDLDNFKNVNDALGHDAGDQLLCVVAERLRTCVRGYDVVSSGGGVEIKDPNPAVDLSGSTLLARLGGDEFSVLLTDIKEPQDCAVVAERVIESLSQPIFLQEGHEVFVGASIGISVFPNDGTTAESLLKHSDIAMYRAKAAGKNTYRFFDASMNESATLRLQLESDMRAALEQGQFELYYQPKVCLRDPTRRDVEALIRWQHPEQGWVSPGMFIPIAEANGFIRNIGDWVMQEACRQVKVWNDAGIERVTVAINLSAVQISFGSPVEGLLKALGASGVPAGQVELEITESGLMKNEEQAVETLAALKDLGISLALDDFGTGYSSLSYLRTLPIDTLKVDSSFVRDLEHNRESVKVLESIIGLARKLRLRVVAEGVETEQQLQTVRTLGVEVIQGYYFSPPLHPDKVMAFFERDAGRCWG